MESRSVTQKNPALYFLTLFQPRRGNPPDLGFSLAIATDINRSTPNFLTFNPIQAGGGGGTLCPPTDFSLQCQNGL